MKTKMSIQMIILNALEQDSNSLGNGLSVSELANVVFGNYHKSTAKFHEKKISTSMGRVCEFGAANNIVVFAVKENTNPKTPEIKSRIIRWRLLNIQNKQSIDEFTDALIAKKKNGEAHTLAFKRMLDFASKKGVLTNYTYAQLGIPFSN